MQFGTNDGGAVNDASRARGTIKGIGEEVQEIDNQLTKQHEVVHSFGWYLRQFITEVRAKGATPLVCSLVPRKIWKDGKIQQDKESYAGWAAQVATAEKAPFLDLNGIIADRYDVLGHDPVMKLYPQVTPDEHTHTDLAGAEFSAGCVVAALKSLPQDPLAPYFSEKAQGVATAALP
jgi:rhamnogalacturonan acetylesterase